MKVIWFQRNPLLVISYLSLRRNGESIHGRKLAQELQLSQGSVSMILRQLHKLGMVSAVQAGKTITYSANRSFPMFRSFRQFENQLVLQPLIQAIKESCRQIILFGSCATGDDGINSDIDLFVLTDDPATVRDRIGAIPFDRELRPVIVDPLELTMMESNDKEFLAEIRKGVVMWEAGHEDTR